MGAGNPSKPARSLATGRRRRLLKVYLVGLRLLGGYAIFRLASPFRSREANAAYPMASGRAVAFDASGGFVLPNGAMRAPDASWVLRRRLAELPAESKKRFLPLCPDFVVELRSPSDPLSQLRAKMEEYRSNGARLGWLVDPEARFVEVYRPERPVERLEGPTELSGDPELPGFVLDLGPVWATL